jgi:hypothetical protein
MKASFQAFQQSFLVQHHPCEHPSHFGGFRSTAELGTGFFSKHWGLRIFYRVFLFSLKTR